MSEILGTITLRMSKKDQRKLGAFFYKAACGVGHAAIICDARVFSPRFSGVWRSDPQWKVAIIDHDLYDAINALLVKAKKPENHE